ncbi:MAG: ABC transporter substrate-binding protein [Chloroflexota bacterium]
MAGSASGAALAGCGPLAPAGQTTARLAPEQGASLLFAYWPVGGQVGVEVVNDAMSGFFAKFPQVKVETLPAIGFNHHNKLVALATAGTPADTAAVDNYRITEFAHKGIVKVLDPLIKAEGFDLNQYFPATLVEGAYRGKRYALPYIGSTRIMYYNVDMFEQAGLPRPEQLWEAGKWTWEAFQEAAVRLTTRDGGGVAQTVGWIPDRNFNFIAPWVWGAKGSLLNKEHTRFTMAEPGGIRAIQFQQDLVQRYRAAASTADLKAGVEFDKNRAAMTGGWRGHIIRMRQNEFRWEVAPLPMGPAGKVAEYKGNSMTVAAETKFPGAAWELAKYMAGPEADRRYVRNGGATPLKANVDVFLSEQPPTQNKYYLEPLEKGFAKLLPLGPYWQELAEEANKDLGPIIMDGKSVKDGLETAAATCNEILARWAMA